MENTKINIKHLEIKVVKVGNAKMTKSVFNQMEDVNAIFNSDNSFIGSLLGYVNIPDSYRNRVYILWSFNGHIRKTELYNPKKQKDLKYLASDYTTQYWVTQKEDWVFCNQIFQKFYSETIIPQNQLFISI